MPKVFISAGSNLGDRLGFLNAAQKSLAAEEKIKNFRSSSVYETEPVNCSGGKFLNVVWQFETDFSVTELLEYLKEIEVNAGRKNKGESAARTLDLDILFFGDEKIQTSDLVVPHPKISDRAFVLIPLAELAGDKVESILNGLSEEELENLKKQTNGVNRISKIYEENP